MNYCCEKCGKGFSQKGHLIAHLNKKKTCEKCNVNFTTQYAFINGNCTHVNNYQLNKKDKVVCCRGHELVLCNGTKVKKYFRHKNPSDVGGDPMTEWHSRMQGYFPITEQEFRKISEDQIKNRRADVFIKEHNYVIEIQHSKIDDSTVICRHQDYMCHGVNVIWIIDGNTKDVQLEELSDGTFLIIFAEDWKYKSFKYNYDFILLDVDDKIFKIPVKEVCNKMILLKEWKHIDVVFEELQKNPKHIWDMWMDDNEIKATLTVHQKGAGNGKTYGIWKSILTNLDKEVYVIVTKQHSAKYVIKKELNEQEKRNEFHIENMENKTDEEYNKKFIIKYTHKTSKRECKVIIGTIDSFIYGLSHPIPGSGKDFFEGLLITIHEQGCTKVNSNTGGMKYAGENIELNKKAEIWIDEAQDLNEKYFNAMVKMMFETKVDVVIVGDELQSLEYEDNLITKSKNKIPNININRVKPINENRRIKVNQLAEEINSLVRFSKYDMLPISSASDSLKDVDKPMKTIDMPDISKSNQGGPDFEKISKCIETIIEEVKNQVEKNHYNPEDFLFIFPIMKNNIMAGELETRLNEFWIDKKDEGNTYKKYAILHKHEEGSVIDLNLSKSASRIVSIRSSKGDGRKVVFVLGCTEESLKIVSRCKEKNFIYESYFHVALTRAEEKVYFGLVKNNDDIHERFGSVGLVEYIPKIRTNLQLDKLITYVDKGALIHILQTHNIEEYREEEPSKSSTPLVDWNYHCIRRPIYLMYAIFDILEQNKNNSNFKLSQLKTILDKLNKLNIECFPPKQFYAVLNKTEIDNPLKEFPLCDLSYKSIYKSYCSQIKNIMESNKVRYRQDELSLGQLKPLHLVVQWYMIEIYSTLNYHQTTPTTLYNVFDYFSNPEFEENKVTELLTESGAIKETVDKVMHEIHSTDTDVKWNIEHQIHLDGGGAKEFDDFKISKRHIEIIGFSEKSVYHMMFKSDFNQLNYWDTMIEILLDRFLIHNTTDKGKDIEKFKNKKIITYLFSLKKKSYERFDWNWENEVSSEIKTEIKKSIVLYFSGYNKQLFQYSTFVKGNKDNWTGKGKSPMEYIASNFGDVVYVRDFFMYLHSLSEHDKGEVKKILNDEDKFYDQLNKYIEDMCDRFFGFNNTNDDDDW